tara:strand:+ start:537 stop:1910 length:1374 start_codon:yes stop_codon:yes gene_type:complete
MTSLHCPSALLPDGWFHNVRLEIDYDGTIISVESGAAEFGAERAAGPVVPGMPNLHSHSFQRALAGRTERAGPGSDDFWTWREVMYKFVDRVDPDALRAVTAWLYADMLKAGYTSVGEFHYLHHGPEGESYDDPAEMSHQIVAAAKAAGIGLTHLPVLYAYGGFGEEPPNPSQRRFVCDPDLLMRIVDSIALSTADDTQFAIGIAPHSLRAASDDMLDAAISTFSKSHAEAPIHIHVAEQLSEVEDCVLHTGLRPVAWALDNLEISERWCLIHATHLAGSEISRLANSGAVVGICPTTEANLGDGIFPARSFLDAGGSFGIGSDSHITIDPAEELRLLEYAQRLLYRHRYMLTTDTQPSVGAALYTGALKGGTQALARPIGEIAVGKRADLVVLDEANIMLTEFEGDAILDAWVFASHANFVKDVMVGGQWVVQDGRHQDEEAITDAAREALSRTLT